MIVLTLSEEFFYLLSVPLGELIALAPFPHPYPPIRNGFSAILAVTTW
jgi:hypothetical protein